MLNPLNEQIVELLVTVMKLEQQRDKEQESLAQIGAFPVMSLNETARGKLLPRIEQLDRLTSRINSLQQKLVSLELLMLDNTIKSLQLTTTQVLTSSTKLENFSKVLIYVTALLGIISIFNTGVVMLPYSPAVGFVVIVISSIGMILLGITTVPKIRKSLKQ